jgi:UDP-N-acetylmuramoyl-tripeptide--D-alanyl-D-alanine ligase
VIDDAYNASPVSVEAALRALAALPARRRIAVLGPMAELGPSEADDHRHIAGVASALGVEVITVGTSLYGIEPTDDPLSAVGPVGEGVAVLVKGSRVARLETVAAALAALG